MALPTSRLERLSFKAIDSTGHPAMSLRMQRRVYRLSLLISDGLALGLAFYLAYWVRFDLQWALAPEVVPPPQFYGQLVLMLVPVWLGLFAFFGLYNWGNLLGGTVEYARAFNACCAGMMIVVVATFLVPGFVVSRGWLLFAWILSFFLVFLTRFWGRRIVYALRSWGYFLAPAAIIGTNEEALALASQLSEGRSSGLSVLGFVNGQGPHDTVAGSGLPILGKLSEVVQIAERLGLENLVVSVTAIKREELLELYEAVGPLKNTELRLSSGLYEVLTTGVRVNTFGFVPLVSLNKLRLEPPEALMKATLEYLLTVVGLIAISPFLFLIAFLIKLDSSGPVLHRRRVLGTGGEEFDALKFRTMYVKGEEILQQHPQLEKKLKSEKKLKDDPRITRVGRWLRQYSLDELPQLFNVLKGQMSLVGPRMISPEEVAEYGKLKWNLLTVKPGMTGLWQVSGRSDLTYEDRVRLDMYYIRNYTIWRDLQILFIETPVAVLKGRGAY